MNILLSTDNVLYTIVLCKHRSNSSDQGQMNPKPLIKQGFLKTNYSTNRADKPHSCFKEKTEKTSLKMNVKNKRA